MCVYAGSHMYSSYSPWVFLFFLFLFLLVTWNSMVIQLFFHWFFSITWFSELLVSNCQISTALFGQCVNKYPNVPNQYKKASHRPWCCSSSRMITLTWVKYSIELSPKRRWKINYALILCSCLPSHGTPQVKSFSLLHILQLAECWLTCCPSNQFKQIHKHEHIISKLCTEETLCVPLSLPISLS